MQDIEDRALNIIWANRPVRPLDEVLLDLDKGMKVTVHDPDEVDIAIDQIMEELWQKAPTLNPAVKKELFYTLQGTRYPNFSLDDDTNTPDLRVKYLLIHPASILNNSYRHALDRCVKLAGQLLEKFPIQNNSNDPLVSAFNSLGMVASNLYSQIEIDGKFNSFISATLYKEAFDEVLSYYEHTLKAVRNGQADLRQTCDHLSRVTHRAANLYTSLNFYLTHNFEVLGSDLPLELGSPPSELQNPQILKRIWQYAKTHPIAEKVLNDGIKPA